jgi:hypothetical protein
VIHIDPGGTVTTTTLLDEVLPEFVVKVVSGWLRRDFRHRVARIAEGSA